MEPLTLQMAYTEALLYNAHLWGPKMAQSDKIKYFFRGKANKVAEIRGRAKF